MRAYVLALILLLTACAPLGRQYEVPMDKLTTADGQAIAFTYTAAKPGSPGAILLHQFRRDRHDYDSFAPQLQKAGYNVIAIDVRGHGQSSGSAQNEADFQNIPLDIAAAKNFLAKKGADTKHLLLIGASFTANSIINDAATDKDVVAVIAISPGMDFKGIKPEQGIRDVPATLLIAAEDDPYSASSVRKLAELNPAVSTKIYPRGGHAVTLFNQTTLAKDILAWLQ